MPRTLGAFLENVRPKDKARLVDYMDISEFDRQDLQHVLDVPVDSPLGVKIVALLDKAHEIMDMGLERDDDGEHDTFWTLILHTITIWVLG